MATDFIFRQMTSANAYGIAGSDYIDTEDENADAISNGNGISIYHGPDFYEYTFLNRNPDNPRGDFVFSARKIRTRAVCEQYTLAGSGVPRSYNGSLWVTGLVRLPRFRRIWCRLLILFN